MSDLLPVPSTEEPEITPPSPQEIIAAHYAQLRGDDGGLVFDAFHAQVKQIAARNKNPARKRAQFKLLKVLENSSILVLSAADLLALLDRAQDRLYDPTDPPFWHKFPQWIEWDEVYLGDHDLMKNSTYQAPVGAFWVYPYRMTLNGEPTLVARAEARALDFTSDALVYLPNGTWACKYEGPCHSFLTCSLGRRTEPNKPYWLQEEADEANALQSNCACWLRGRYFSRVFSCLAEYLRDTQRSFEPVIRAKPLPPRPRSGKRAQDAWQRSCDEVKAWNRGHPDYTRLT